MHRSTLKPTLGAALFIPCLLLTACAPEAGLGHPPANPETPLLSSAPPVHKGYRWNTSSGRLEVVHYAKVDGQAVVEGDIVIGPVEEVEALTREVEARGKPEAERVYAQGVIRSGENRVTRWANAVVPYTIHSALPDPSRVTGAIAAWQANTRVRFVPRTTSNATQYPDYVTFQPAIGVCRSEVGMAGGQQMVNLDPGCYEGTVIHEIGHVLGLWHEQSREDRNLFVSIQWDNIDPAYARNFDQHISDGDDKLTYDYGSIMHYGPYDFSKNGLPTIVPLQNVVIGQRTVLSSGDTASIRLIYSIDDTDYFVQQTYLDVLKSKPDMVWYGYYVNYLKSCQGASACLTAARTAVARAVLESPENRQQDPELDPASPGYNAAFVTHCYTNFLQRQPSASEHAYWLNALNAGGTYSDVVRGFITSPEYRQRFGS
ncbi:M12 family metallopeptidase [Archangium violaceum]|uniref:M12 family metallopeptidase n=1 Tax=Archangium violaceum TaxID=83451 RepID=UPI0006989F4E|nr:M12 family metallopeptidase [Archangium violaceum]